MAAYQQANLCLDNQWPRSPVIQELDLPILESLWTMASVDDFNRDGSNDLLLRNPTTGKNHLRFMDAINLMEEMEFQELGPTWDIVGADDFNSDGQIDILLRNPTTGKKLCLVHGWDSGDRGQRYSRTRSAMESGDHWRF